MNDRTAIWFPIGLMLLLAAVTYWLARTVEHPQPGPEGAARHDPDYIVENFSATQLGQDGTPSYVLSATKMTHYPDDDSTQLEQPDLTELRKGQAPLQARAERGLVSHEGKEVTLIGKVWVSRQAVADRSALTLTTDWLRVLPDRGIASTNRPVTITDAHTIVTAVGLEWNNHTGVLKLLSRVKGRYEKAK